jgi:threonyl-tRNA synthetase
MKRRKCVMKIQLKDGSIREYESQVMVMEAAKDLGLAKTACAGKVNGETVDLRTKIENDCELSILTFDEEEGRSVFWHTSAHILAQAVKRLYPDTKLGIGPAVKEGFYYDFDRELPFTEEDLKELEKEMKKIIKEELPIKRFTLPKEEARALMQSKNEPYKLELLEALKENEEISFYQQGEYVDLCAGPHLMNTRQVKAFKLTTIAGAYWHGDEKNKMLTRIYGTAFTKQADMEEYFYRLEEAKRRDHRKLGKDLELFLLLEEGPGFPFFLPKGLTLKNTLIQYWRELHEREGYVEIETPVILNRELWETSGHWFHFRENMYTLKIDEEDFAIKPMSCPGGMLVFNSSPHSYRDLPMRVGELGLVHRHEMSGALHGLLRVRCFTQDDAHIFMTEEQVREEIKGVARLIDEVYRLFGFKYHVELSTKPENSIGSDEDWELATNSLKSALKDLDTEYSINEGDGAFYGPKIDFHLEDSLGRTWQCGTIQLDFQLPLRFGIEYTGADGEKHRPIMIHRVIFGSIERFLGILIEHYAGKFPLWLSPVQAKLLPISEKFAPYAALVFNQLKSKGIRCELDNRDEKIGYKIRDARLQKIPYMLIVGEKEMESNTVAVRNRELGEQGNLEIEVLIENMVREIREKA